MAGIDKTYCKTYKEFLELINWAKDTKFTCPNGLIIDIIDYINLAVTERCFKYFPVPVMNTPQVVDYFLIKYCPLEFVQNTMKKVYDTFYDEVKQGVSDYDKFDINKVKIATKYKILERPKDKEHPYRKSNRIGLYRRNPIWSIEAQYYNGEYFTFLDYNNTLKRFIYENELYSPYNFSMDKFCECNNIKSLCRQLIKAKIPSNTFVRIQGFYVGEQWKIKFK